MRDLLSKRIKQERIAKQKTQEEISTLLDITRATYGYYENGKVLPPVDKVLTLANYFDVSVDYLLGNGEKQMLDVIETIEHILQLLKNHSDYISIDGSTPNEMQTKLIACSLENTLKTTNILMEDIKQ